jgi:hypothetical protein
MLRNKSIKIFINYLFGPLLFLWLCYVIYTQILLQPHLEASWQQIKDSVTSHKIFLLGGVVLLMLANWSVEAAKWKVSVSAVCPISFRRAFRAVLSGVSFSVSMPNRMGEYAGRILYLPEGNRLKAVPATLVGSISQLLVTLVTGVGGLLILKQYVLQSGLINSLWYSVLLFGTAIVTVVLTVFYFSINAWRQPLQRWLRNSRHLYLFESLRVFDASLLLRLLSLSFVRYIIFSIQYVLLFYFFEVHVPAYLVWSATSALFLAMAVIPTIALAELGLRGQLSLQLMGLFTDNSLGVVLTSVTVWVINLIVPALAGSVLILTFKVFRRTHEIV